MRVALTLQRLALGHEHALAWTNTAPTKEKLVSYTKTLRAREARRWTSDERHQLWQKSDLATHVYVGHEDGPPGQPFTVKY